MKTVHVSYSDFKSFVTSKSLLPQYTQDDSSYILFATEGNVCWESLIAKNSADETDFLANVSIYNQPLEIKAGIGRPLRVSASPQPLGTVEHWKGFQITVPIGQTSGYIDITFPTTVYLRGGYIVSNDVDLDDYITADVLLAANNSTYIAGLIDHAWMIPNQPVDFHSAESMAFPTTLKIRVTLNLGTADLNDVHANILVDYFL